ncbi:DUF1989 domain-containing protein [Nocardia puris]|uniref:DUF1989 domain-containing protein n=1 Tax=Nocardia puris TaxID=208602 RepID=A0A366D549_9NOCA|nr:DUF1989 domain-containing protein [Nocardia puris]MBF6214868.1 DUF1989 domain-containing protein [Nocardia puris]MBF6364124.1 DUF1989 domain-containing protein [Nocardia puris]MBF6459053.1 DUF1989 domain-containing protein [Nocardia puris]RBO84594.1 hypothetical protein DFR74_116155 [Nocardia puris]
MTETSTASTGGAREHARAQAAAALLATPDLPSGVDPARITWSQRIPPAGYANVVLGRGTRVRFADPAAAACAHVLLLRADAPWERLNVADTVKVPWQAYLSPGHPLLTDQGRVLATVVADTSGRHDTLCGPSAVARDLLHSAGAKQGLAPRDIAPTVSFFRGVRVESDGALTATGSAEASASIDLLLHLPAILLVANAPHPLDERPTTDLDVVAWAAPADLTTSPGADPEYLRAVENTEAAWTALTVEATA